MSFHAAKFSFGPKPLPPQEGGIPAALSVKEVHRRTAMLKEAADVLPHLPAPGEALHCLQTGRYDLMILLTAVLDSRADVCQRLRIATLSLKQRNAVELVDLIDRGKVTQATLLCSEFFRDHNTGIYEGLQKEFAERPLGKHRLAAARSHCKVVTMEMAGGDRFVLEGSANLRTNSNVEQFCLLNHAELHSWHAGWIDGMVNRGQVNEG